MRRSERPVPYTPVESVVKSPAVAAFPIPQERCMRDGRQADFFSARRPEQDPRPFTHVNLKLTHRDLGWKFRRLAYRDTRKTYKGGKNEAGALYSLGTKSPFHFDDDD